MKSHIGKKTTIMVVDDHEIVRSGIVSLLEAIEDIKVVAEASSGETAVKLAQEFNPDVILAIGEGNDMMTAICSHLDVSFIHLVLINFPLLSLLAIF